MSAPAMDWAISQPLDHDPALRAVLLYLAQKHVPDRPLCVSLTALASDLGLAVLVVHVCFMRLMGLGFISLQGGIHEYTTIRLCAMSEVEA
ncbi:promethin [Roseibium sp. TrichSKD4]|uniref:hypothetical protein n=1 Tax=Roseibium sp. TrichSKD4 TaxID=744980 RepID=UPI0001E56396|nr:hypothetical protein [Roseibium sp. TrichSKD4]EFO33920.1 promethin [Roseibium sp. TrichSKD4]